MPLPKISRMKRLRYCAVRRAASHLRFQPSSHDCSKPRIRSFRMWNRPNASKCTPESFGPTKRIITPKQTESCSLSAAMRRSIAAKGSQSYVKATRNFDRRCSNQHYLAAATKAATRAILVATNFSRLFGDRRPLDLCRVYQARSQMKFASPH